MEPSCLCRTAIVNCNAPLTEMEPDLKEFLSKGKVKEKVICRLEKEDIESLDDFKKRRASTYFTLV